jgi:hypothetical protein
MNVRSWREHRAQAHEQQEQSEGDERANCERPESYSIFELDAGHEPIAWRISFAHSQARAHRHAKRPGALLEARVPAPVDRDGSSLFHVCHPSISELRLAEITSNAGHRLASLCTRKALEPPNLINPPKERT